MASNPFKTTSEELIITRVFESPQEAVWKAWTDLTQAREWWGPKDFTVPNLVSQLRPGGKWRAVMRSPDGETYPQHGVFKEIVSPHRLSFTHMWDDEGPESEMLITVSFSERAGKTAMHFHKAPFRTAESLRGEEGGWNEAFDRLQALVEGGRR